MRKQILKPTTWIIAALLTLTAIVIAQSQLTKQVVTIPLDEQEVYCLTRNAYYEALGDSQMSQVAVTHVVLNRLANPSFPKSACDVVYQKNRREDKQRVVCQFSWYCDKRLMNRNIDPVGWKESYDAVLKALSIYYHKGVDVTEGSTFYHAKYVNPNWRNLEKVTSIGSHIYYKVNEECQNNPKACTQRKRSQS